MDTNSCLQSQKEELEVLESIYPDILISDPSGGAFKLDIPIELGISRVAKIVDEDSSSTKPAQMLSISTLPSVLLHLVLPDSYPTLVPPTLVSLSATCSWLSAVSLLEEKLLAKWEPGESVLYDWVAYIRNAEFLDDLALVDPTDDCIRIPHPAPKIIVPLLQRHDKRATDAHFMQASYTCSICFTQYKGARCLLLSCGHVFCRSCLEDYWKLSIAEGDVSRVMCPDAGCVKNQREAEEEDVQRVVTEEELRRWRWLREKRAIERDPSIVHCPMAFCQTPVPRPAAEQDGTYDRLRTCQRCEYSFCSYCKRTWHGAHTPCAIPATETFVLKYLELSEDSQERVVMERQYGKANVATLVAKYREELANQDWLKNSTMACPGCLVNVEKSLGCNHMTCAKCKQHFCYVCGAKIPGSNPYKHFSTVGWGCYNRLFDTIANDEEWEPIDGFEFV